jgi:hypothetical protein
LIESFLDFSHRPVFSQKHDRVGATFTLPEDGNRSSFRNVVLSKKKLDNGQWTMDKVQKHASFKIFSPLSFGFLELLEHTVVSETGFCGEVRPGVQLFPQSFPLTPTGGLT